MIVQKYLGLPDHKGHKVLTDSKVISVRRDKLEHKADLDHKANLVADRKVSLG
jgi:hypothetical protein